MTTIGLDNHATTPLDPGVKKAMDPFWSDTPWNAHSAHFGGELVAQAVKVARGQVAELIGASPSEIIFTSGATEANNLAIVGTALAAMESASHRNRILVSAIEHKCVLAAAEASRRFGFSHETIPVRPDGIVDLGSLESLIDDRVLLVSVMAANNEIGVIQPIELIAEMCERSGAIFHTDAAQAAGKVPFDTFENHCDMASISAHKMYGPGGVGALFVSSGSPLRPAPLLVGGGQEGGLRSGTLPVPLIVGFGTAASAAFGTIPSETPRLTRMAEQFLAKLKGDGVHFKLNGAEEPRLPGSLNICVPGVDAEELISRLGSKLLISTGSACNSGELQGSYVLSALGIHGDEVRSSFRLCFGRFNPESDAAEAASILAKAIEACHRITGEGFQ